MIRSLRYPQARFRMCYFTIQLEYYLCAASTNQAPRDTVYKGFMLRFNLGEDQVQKSPFVSTLGTR